MCVCTLILLVLDHDSLSIESIDVEADGPMVCLVILMSHK